MRRILLIAKRDYLQMVQSKAYLVGLILFPVLFGGGFLVLALNNKSNAGQGATRGRDRSYRRLRRICDSGRRGSQPESYCERPVREPGHAALRI